MYVARVELLSIFVLVHILHLKYTPNRVCAAEGAINQQQRYTGRLPA